MKLIGLTGGLGMGKSTVAQFLRERGGPVVDTDELARELVRPGQPALGEIRAAFGPEMIAPDGSLRREALAQRAFGEASARQQLEAILHPRIRAAWRAQAEEWRQRGQALGVVVIPLLYETGAEAELEAVLCVACSAATQRERLVPRSWSPEQMEQRNRAQLPVERKMLLANYVLWNEGPPAALALQLDRVLSQLAHGSGQNRLA